MISNTEQSSMFRLPEDADANRLCVYNAVMKIRDRCTAPNKPDAEDVHQPRFPEGYEDSSWELVDDADKIKAFVYEVRDRKSWPLYIHGRPGVGKTSIAALVYWVGQLSRYGFGRTRRYVKLRSQATKK